MGVDSAHMLSCVTVSFVAGRDAQYSDITVVYIVEDIDKLMALPRQDDTTDTLIACRNSFVTNSSVTVLSCNLFNNDTVLLR
jgi:hypothetical protein